MNRFSRAAVIAIALATTGAPLAALAQDRGQDRKAEAPRQERREQRTEPRNDRREYRQDNRNERSQPRQERRNDRRDYRQERPSDRRDYRYDAGLTHDQIDGRSQRNSMADNRSVSGRPTA